MRRLQFPNFIEKNSEKKYSFENLKMIYIFVKMLILELKLSQKGASEYNIYSKSLSPVKCQRTLLIAHRCIAHHYCGCNIYKMPFIFYVYFMSWYSLKDLRWSFFFENDWQTVGDIMSRLTTMIHLKYLWAQSNNKSTKSTRWICCYVHTYIDLCIQWHNAQ